MGDQAGNMPHWTKSTPGITGPRPSKRDSTISLEDPVLATQAHHRQASQSAQMQQPLPSQQDAKPALGLLFPQETFHYDPSPLSSPDVDCPPLSPQLRPADVAPESMSPLKKYLDTPDNSERRMMGLPPFEDLEQLPVPAQESWLASSTVDPSWSIVESPEALANDQMHDSKQVQPIHASNETSSWDVVGSPHHFDSTNLDTASADSITLDSANDATTLPHASRTKHKATNSASPDNSVTNSFYQTNIEANTLEASISGPSTPEEEAILNKISAKMSSNNALDDKNKFRGLRKHRVRLHRSRKQDSNKNV